MPLAILYRFFFILIDVVKECQPLRGRLGPCDGHTRTNRPSRSRRTSDGTRNGTIVRWPAGSPGAQAEIRTQFHARHRHRADDSRRRRAGGAHDCERVQQAPYEGVSMRYAFNDAEGRRAPRDAVLRDVRQPRHRPQGLDRGDPHRRLGTRRRRPGVRRRPLGALRHDEDWTQARDVSNAMPDKLRELQRLFLIEATRSTSCRSTTGAAERLNADLAGRPTYQGQHAAALRRHGPPVGELRVLKNKSHAVTAEIDGAGVGAEGVIIAQGGSIGGWSLYAKGGKLEVLLQPPGIQRFYAEATGPIPAGKHQVRMEFDYDGGGLARAARSRSSSTARRSARDAWRRRPMIFSADETATSAEDGALVSDDYASRQRVHAARQLGPDRLGDAAQAADHRSRPGERLAWRWRGSDRACAAAGRSVPALERRVDVVAEREGDLRRALHDARRAGHGRHRLEAGDDLVARRAGSERERDRMLEGRGR